MITWTRQSTAPPFPQLDTYSKIEGTEVAWPEQAALRQDKTRCSKRGTKRVRNHVIWNAVTVREKTHLEDNIVVVKERVTIYVEFLFPIKGSDMQALTRARFECIKTTDEWQSKIRLWNGSEPIQQIHTRDPMSKVTLIRYGATGQT